RLKGRVACRWAHNCSSAFCFWNIANGVMSDLSGEPVAGHDQRQRGLPSLQVSKEQRRRAIVLGKVRLRDAAPNFWLWTMVLFVAFGVIYWHIAERQLQSHKSEVMARQRALVQELEPRFGPVRDRIEAWV